MLDGVEDPLAVITDEYEIRRTNKAYVSLVAGNFSDVIGKKMFYTSKEKNRSMRRLFVEKDYQYKIHTENRSYSASLRKWSDLHYFFAGAFYHR